MSMPIDAIEGIGPAYAAKLAAADIATTNDLILHGPYRSHARTDGEISLARLERWHGMALLTLIDTLDPQSAEALTDAGRGSFHTLDDTSPARLREILVAAEQAGTVPSAPSEARTAAWQRDAVRLQYTGLVAGRITDNAGTPLPGAGVTLGSVAVTADASGTYVLAGVPLWETEMVIDADGRYRFEDTVTLSGPALVKRHYRLAASPDGRRHPARISEWDGQIVSFTAGDRFERRDVDLADLPDDTPLAEYHRGRYQDGLVRLVSLYKVREGRWIIAYRLKVAADQIAGGVPENRVIWKRGGKLTAGDVTVSEFRDTWTSERTWIQPAALTAVPAALEGEA